ncbi:MAG TPA: PKD domain-containing protein, partial [Myxococcaceae bacterium]|nr:PKD domain-containing protein [Myxococcaceae bacterium]
DADGSIVSYRWEFGDGQSAVGPRASHTYRKAGSYAVTLTVRDDTDVSNSTRTATRAVTINEPPRPVISAPDRVCAGTPSAFSARDSADPDGSIARYRWDFGDGQSADGAEVAHAFREPAAYQVTLVVDDGTGVSNSQQETSRRVWVNRPPVALAGPDARVCPGQRLVLDGSRSSDADGGPLRFRWSFGDGEESEGRQVTHAWAKPGTYEARLNVEDDSGTACAASADTLRVQVNAAPVARAGGDRQAFVGGAHDVAHFDATGSNDPDGERLTYHWDFGDGSRAEGARVSHPYLKPGRYKVRLLVRDGSGTSCGEASDEATVEVRARPAPSSSRPAVATHTLSSTP